MVTRALHDAGLHLVSESAEFIRAAEDNPEGFWEHKAIVACNDELLEATGGAWDNPPALPPQGADDPRVAALVPAAEEALAGLRTHAHWGFKDPRTSLTVPFWLDLEPELHFVVCVRHPLEVALSLKQRNQNSYSLGLMLWERYYAAVLEAVPSDRRLVSHYEAFFADPDRELARVCEFAGLQPARARVRTDLRHHSVTVGLADAGVSEHVRSLYTTLCREADFAAPAEPPSDEGRVRRLILEGAVTARRAEQRLAAMERLEERYGASEEELRARIRDLEREVSRTRAVALRKVDLMARQLDVLTLGPVRRFTRRAIRTSAREGPRVARKIAASARPRMQRVVRRPLARARGHRRGRQGSTTGGATSDQDGAHGMAPAAPSTGRPGLRPAPGRLPPEIHQKLGVTRERVRRARLAPGPAARDALEHLPPQAQRAARRLWRGSATLRARGRRVRRRWARGRGSKAVPRGPKYRRWADAYRALVQQAVPEGSSWLVAAPGSPASVRTAQSPPATRFPDVPAHPPADDLALIARVEALRCTGVGFFVVPEGSRAWFRTRGELRDHLHSTYRCLADAAGAGAVFDLSEPATDAHPSLHQEIRRLATGSNHVPAVLDWTDLDLASEMAGVTTFRPPSGAALPYLDNSIDIVVRDEAHDMTEARRVATTGVITIGPGPGGIDVHSVVSEAAAIPCSGPSVLVWSVASGADETWARALAERVASEDASLESTAGFDETLRRLDAFDVVVVVEPGVLPLPGAITRAAASASARPDTAIGGKTLGPDGRIEAAGGTVFSDRSVALVAGGSDDVGGSWHDYVRPICWAPGLVAASASLWDRTPVPGNAPARTLLREWCATVWERGGSVVYDPAIVAVRVAGHGGEPSTPLHTSAWQRVLDLRPRRPAHLSDDDWRTLLAHDDVEACRA